ncbi:MAG: DMT family transporter [Rhodospirillaceae bacterium]
MHSIKRLTSTFSDLPGNTRGIFWMLFAAAFYAATYATVRYLSKEGFETFQIVFFRSFLGIIFLLPWLFKSGIQVMKTTKVGTYSIRTGLNFGGMVLLMWALGNLELQTVTGLMFTTPLFTVLFVAIILGEHVGLRRGAALVIGFVGAMVIIRPGYVELSWPMIGVLLTSAAYALVNVTTKTLSVTDSSSKIVLYVFLGMTVLSLGPAIYTWNTIAVSHVPWILGLGLLSLLAVQGVTRALAAGEAAVVMPFNFMKLPFAAVLGVFLFAELPDLMTGVGALIIFASTYYIARREAYLRAQKTEK